MSEGSKGQQHSGRAMLSLELGGEERATFVELILFEVIGDKKQGTRRSPVGRRREPPLEWQGELLYRYRRDSSMMVEEGGQLDRRFVFGRSNEVFVETSFSGRNHFCCRLRTAVVANTLR